jgi:HD-GYP domain-containing protein (c-di-GMP phosphodiesterase class II)
MVRGNSAATVYRTFVTASRKAGTAGQLQEAQSRLAAVYEANQIISSERDLKKLFERVMDQIFSLIPAHNGVIMLRDKESGELVTEYVKTGSGQTEVTISSTIVSRAQERHEAVITYNAASDARFGSGASIIVQNISSAMCTPLRCQDENLGVIYVDTRGTKSAFTERDLEMLVGLAGPAAIAIRNAQYMNELEQAYQETLVMMANAIELRDHYTVGHTWRVTNFAVETARMMGWTEEKLKECEMGGVLHDVGKIGIDDAILHKPGRLDEEEFEKMKVHPERGARILQDSRFLTPLVPYALYHHEKYDGSGYPYGMKGEDIPTEGRLIAVADTFDAMTSNRPYRKGLDPEVAIERLLECRGTQLDPDIVDVFVQCYRDGKIGRIMQEYHKGSKSIACPFCSTYIRIPEGGEAGGEFECGVCHRRIRLLAEDDEYYGEVVAGAERNHSTGRTNSEPAHS